MPSEQHAATWAQFVADVDTFIERYPGPKSVAHLVWEAAVLGFVNGTQHAAGRSHTEVRADFLKDHAVVTGVLDVAELDCERWVALRTLRTRISPVEETTDA